MNPFVNIAVRAAREAGALQMQYFGRADALTVKEKQANDFVTEVDRAAERIIVDIIHKAYPTHGILAEESGARKGKDYLWIIDPLDGTTNYLHNFPQFAVSIALQLKDDLVAAVVYDPVRDELFTSAKGGGAYVNDRRLRVGTVKGLKGALIGTGIPYRDFRHADAYFGMMRSIIQESAGVRRPGSASLDFAWLAAGRIDGFWELGLSAWDFAAGALLVKEAGGVVSDLGGGDTYLQTGNVVAGNIKVHQALLDHIKPFLSDDLRA